MIISLISLSGIIFCLTSQGFESAFVTICRDDLHVPTWHTAGKYHCPFESGDCRLITITIGNIPLSQDVDRNPCPINTFSVFDHVFQVIQGEVSLCHAKNGMVGKAEGWRQILSVSGSYIGSTYPGMNTCSYRNQWESWLSIRIYIMSNCWFSLQTLFKNLRSPLIIALTNL